MKVNFASLVLVALAGCGSSDVCKTVMCPNGASYKSCTESNGTVVDTFNSTSCACAPGDYNGCEQCTQELASYCLSGSGSGSGDGGVGGGNGGGGGNGDGGVSVDCTPGAGGNTADFVFKTIMLPAQRTDYAFDLVGSGRLENQFGIIMGALAQQNLGPQANLDAALQSGQEVELLAETSSDPTFQSDACARAVVTEGQAVNFPPTPGARYMVSPSVVPASFAGPIVAGRLNSAPPATTKHPVSLQIALPIVAGVPPVQLTIIGAHVQLANAAGGVMSGQINGAIKESDVNNTVVPALAASIANRLAADKASGNITATDTQLLTLFDTGGAAGMKRTGCNTSCPSTCQNPSNVANACACAKSADGVVDECEVATNAIIASVTAPDVQMFDANGNYGPNPQPTASSKDSLSIGFGFSAVPAKF